MKTVSRLFITILLIGTIACFNTQTAVSEGAVHTEATKSKSPSEALFSNLEDVTYRLSRIVDDSDLAIYRNGTFAAENHARASVDHTRISNGASHFKNREPILSEGSVHVESRTIIVPDEYATIQAAVDAANAGDTILVREGTYIENVMVLKSLNIRSEKGAQKTNVQAANADADVFELDGASSVNLSGFAIKGARGAIAAGIAIDSHFEGEGGYCRIENNIISDNYYAISCIFADHNTIANNLIIGDPFDTMPNNYVEVSSSDSNSVLNNELIDSYICVFASDNNLVSGNGVSGKAWFGIEVVSSSNNTISSNTVRRSRPGRGLDIGPGSGNLIINNTLEGCGLEVSSAGNNVVNCTVNGKALVYMENESGLEISEADAGQIILVGCQDMIVRNSDLSNTTVGIELYETSHSVIENNTFQNNGKGVLLDSGLHNIIRDNTFGSNGHGVSIGGVSSNNNVSWNYIHDSRGAGIYIWSDEAQNNTAQNNDIYGNYDGFRLASCSYNTIQENRIWANSVGIYTSYSTVINGVPIWTTNNRILRNSVSNNSAYGIYLRYARSNLFHNNDFVNNTRQAYSAGGENIWDNGYPSGGNYWSDYVGVDVKSGPSQNLAGEDGVGDTQYGIDANNVDRYPLMKPYAPQRVLVYTDKTAYHAGETMKLGLHVTNTDGKASVCFAVWVSRPGSPVYVYMHMHNITLPASFSYNSPTWQTLQLPTLPPGTYVWHAAFANPATHKVLVEDTAQWQFN